MGKLANPSDAAGVGGPPGIGLWSMDMSDPEHHHRRIGTWGGGTDGVVEDQMHEMSKPMIRNNRQGFPRRQS